MSFAQAVRGAASAIAQGGDPRQVLSDAVDQAAEQYGLDPADFLAARDQNASVGTRIEQQTTSLANAGEALNRSRYERGPEGPVHVICPMVIPRGRTARALLPVILLVMLGLVGSLVTLPLPHATMIFFGPHYWVLTAAIGAFSWWRQGMVMVPDGCVALISKFGKLEQVVGPGRVTLLNPWKRVSYIINTTREYPFNAPIREAPTRSGVKASVDLFLQFRIEDPIEFVFTLGAVQGFQDKLNNAISETTRSLIYEQEAAKIYDLVGENTTRLLEQLNQQFLPAVRLTSVNITHAEPSSQEYRMNLAAPEMVRVAKEAYTYEYQLQLRKEQNEETSTRSSPPSTRPSPGSRQRSPSTRRRWTPPWSGRPTAPVPWPGSGSSRRRAPRRPMPRCWKRKPWTSARSARLRPPRSSTTASNRTCWTSWKRWRTVCRSSYRSATATQPSTSSAWRSSSSAARTRCSSPTKRSPRSVPGSPKSRSVSLPANPRSPHCSASRKRPRPLRQPSRSRARHRRGKQGAARPPVSRTRRTTTPTSGEASDESAGQPRELHHQRGARLLG